MSTTSTMTATTEPDSSKSAPAPPMPQSNETLMKIKKTFTTMHFVSLFIVCPLALRNHDYLRHAIAFSVVTFVVAYFMFPIGLITPEQAPEYTKGNMRYLPSRDGSYEIFGPAPSEVEKKQKNKSRSGDKKKRN
ncbi:hypothetical protein THAOC_04620 [Thalassiosira oceanica]|uniref:Uncharacterized protein n=1 Tax=Thalassiosira oceanica TaxID=159749 RepID=K0T855_THAOC|nr:hypothetical protein THAOC_04620 [Thalassiosira oceanica]|mmetsp:Transcript_32283/g.77171  ORF Transcript_32283/g.77171 Transcript_32283/m.77171 type:complete len:134 (-) Transcript_32283:141-542(-)|eukprot:EJK73740.1 hypothetical protein THAOC_04620 [Thalassiosira oceanica]